MFELSTYVAGLLCGAFVASPVTVALMNRRLAAATEGPDMAELHSSSKIWYPVGGEWRIGYRGAPTDSSMRYYLASDYQTFKEVRVAASDFREYEDGKPLLELAPPLSVVEFEREMETDR